MRYNTVKCEAVKVNTESGVCPGIARTRQGEVYEIGARTPEPEGICLQALSAIGPMKLAMSLTDKMDWETNGYHDVTCPHGMVTFRLSRATWKLEK
jgi:uncharacterized repeat protein (TIGR04076 family)